MKQISTLKPNKETMLLLFRESGLTLSSVQLDQFWTFHQHLRLKNDDLDLTRIRRFEDLVYKHYIDSAIVTRFITLASPILDIGTGAGFPGIPIKIMGPSLKFVLSESRQKRAGFLKEVCAMLNLEGMEIFSHKVTRHTTAVDLSCQVKSVITRAVEPIIETLHRIASLLPVDGEAIFMKGPSCQPEIDEALACLGREYELSQDISYSIPETNHLRRLLVFTRKKVVNEIHEREVVVNHSSFKEKEITSRSNPVFKRLSGLLTGKGIKKEGLSLLSGAKYVKETLAEFACHCVGWITHDFGDPPPSLAPPDIVWYKLGKELFHELNIYGTNNPILLIKTPEISAWSDIDQPEGCTLFIPFQDPANVGTAIRSAAAFGVAQVVLLEEAAHPFHHKSLRVAGSTVFRVPIFRGPSIKNLSVTSLPVFALSSHGSPLPDVRFPKSFGLVAGVEGPGLPENSFSGQLLSIPMQQGVDSLNAATAIAIALYQWKTQTGFDPGL
ncbi:MAG: 16S rRNA (guanine(527)-N(7))-methyltransferase RsmG [Pseudomonadota bacterium]